MKKVPLTGEGEEKEIAKTIHTRKNNRRRNQEIPYKMNGERRNSCSGERVYGGM